MGKFLRIKSFFVHVHCVALVDTLPYKTKETWKRMTKTIQNVFLEVAFQVPVYQLRLRMDNDWYFEYEL